MLFLGPGSGAEVEQFAYANSRWTFNFLEASANFRTILRQRFARSVVLEPATSGLIPLPDASQDVVCAFCVLHHIPNVSTVVAEISRVTRPGGLFLVREPCSSMGDWRYPRSATPNERGISRRLLTEIARRSGFRLTARPVPIVFEPFNRLLKRTVGVARVPFSLLYGLDRLVSGLLVLHDHYWRDTWLKKMGPSSYFYSFRKARD